MNGPQWFPNTVALLRLDEAFCDEQLRFGGQRIDHQRRTGGQDTDLRAALRTKRVVDDDLFLPDDLGAELVLQLLHVGLPVAAGCDQKRDIDVRVSLPELLQHQRKDIAAGDRPRMIADDDDGIAFSLCQLAQARTGDRMPHGLGDQLPAAAGRLQLAESGGDHALRRRIDRDRSFSVGQTNLHRDPSWLPDRTDGRAAVRAAAKNRPTGRHTACSNRRIP